MALNTFDINPDIWNKAVQYWCLGSLYVLVTSIRWKWVFQGTTTSLYFGFELKKILDCRQIKALSQEGFASLLSFFLICRLCRSARPYARSELFRRWSQTELCIFYNGTQKELSCLSSFCFLKTLEFNNPHFNILCFSFRKWAWLEGC